MTCPDSPTSRPDSPVKFREKLPDSLVLLRRVLTLSCAAGGCGGYGRLRGYGQDADRKREAGGKTARREVAIREAELSSRAVGCKLFHSRYCVVQRGRPLAGSGVPESRRRSVKQ